MVIVRKRGRPNGLPHQKLLLFYGQNAARRMPAQVN
jgi:hypothetical protein